MLQTLQILQITFYGSSVIGVFFLGVSILTKPVFVFRRRLFLLIFLPLLLANPLALIEAYALPEDTPSLDWRLWLVLGVDIGLIAAGYRLLSGWLAYGLSKEEVENTLQSWFTAQGWDFRASTGTRSTWWGGQRSARQLQAASGDQTLTFWLSTQGGEVRLQGETQADEKYIHKARPSLRRVDKPYHLQDHLTGLLYIVLAVVLAVLGWIFFFEPRLILID